MGKTITTFIRAWASPIIHKMEFDGPVSTPRINSGLLNSYVNMHIRIVGRVAGQQQLDVTLEASDGGSVLVKRNPATASIYSSHAFVEVLGTVQPDLSISEIAATGFGAQFDLQNYDQLVKFSHVRPINELFGISA